MIFINKIAPPAVLPVDADFEQSRAGKSALEAQGCSVVCASSGEEAFTTFARKNFDAIVVEPMLPDMHVPDFVDEIAVKRNRKIPSLSTTPVPATGKIFATGPRTRSLIKRIRRRNFSCRSRLCFSTRTTSDMDITTLNFN